VVLVLLVVSTYIIVKLFGFFRRAWNRRSQRATEEASHSASA
jgi:hypothetical protein